VVSGASGVSLASLWLADDRYQPIQQPGDFLAQLHKFLNLRNMNPSEFTGEFDLCLSLTKRASCITKKMPELCVR